MSDETEKSAAEIRDAARAELAALEAQLPTLQRALLPWLLRVVVLAVAVFAIMRWRGTDPSMFVPLVGLYALVSLALTYFAFSAKHKAFAGRRAQFEAQIADAEEEDG